MVHLANRTKFAKWIGGYFNTDVTVTCDQSYVDDAYDLIDYSFHCIIW